jgi:DNA-binding NarL/FixJ family response regulator
VSVLILYSEESSNLRAHAQAMGARLARVNAQTLHHLLHDLSTSNAWLERPPEAKPDEFSRVLSAREQQVVSELAKGLSFREIARVLAISVRTVESHTRNIKRKLKLVGLRQLMSYAVAQSISQRPARPHQTEPLVLRHRNKGTK